MNFKNRPPLSQTDKLCLIALVGCFLAPFLSFWAIDEATIRAAEEDKPPVEAVVITAPMDCTPLVEAVEAARESAESAKTTEADLYDETIPLDRELQEVLRAACEEHGVAPCDILGIIFEESRFAPDADNGKCYGYMGLNKKYYPSDLTLEEQIRAGVDHLAGQIKRYDGDIQAALRGYNKGWDDGDRRYARRVLDASEKWGCG